MRTIEEIESKKKVIIQRKGADGGAGIIHLNGWEGSVIWSNGGGWEHVSVAPFKRRYTPTWSDMCDLKDIFFRDDEWVVQFHPAKSEYVNNMPNCLHLWRPISESLPTPPSILTGIKEGQSSAEVRKAIQSVL